MLNRCRFGRHRLCNHLMELGELLVPDQGLLTGKLPPAQQTGQFSPVCHPALFLFLFTSFFVTVSFSTVGWDQSPVRRRGMLRERGQMMTTCVEYAEYIV